MKPQKAFNMEHVGKLKNDKKSDKFQNQSVNAQKIFLFLD